MEMVIFIIYVALGYWAVNKTIYANKVVIYSDGIALWGKKVGLAMIIGFILIPIAIVKTILDRHK